MRVTTSKLSERMGNRKFHVYLFLELIPTHSRNAVLGEYYASHLAVPKSKLEANLLLDFAIVATMW